MNKKKYNKWIDNAVKYIETIEDTGMCEALTNTKSSLFSKRVSQRYIKRHMPYFNYFNFKAFMATNYETLYVKSDPSDYWLFRDSPICKEARIQFLKSLKK